MSKSWPIVVLGEILTRSHEWIDLLEQTFEGEL